MTMYSVHDYGAMIADRVRMDAYAEALRQAVKPGSVVLDLGSGAGIFALLACRLGARHVYAIEPSDIIEVGREIAAANGYSGRITFLQQRSEQVSLPEPVDVIVSDMRGVLPCLGGNLRALIDARRRFLAPGGTMIGRRDTVWAAMVEAPELYRSHFTGWEESTLGFDQQAARRIMANSWGKGRVPPEQFLAEPCRWATVDYETVAGPNFRAEMNWTVARAGTAHGLVVWFDAELADGVGFSNAPGQPELIYSSAFFPWPEPVSLDAGDRGDGHARSPADGRGHVRLELGQRDQRIGEDTHRIPADDLARRRRVAGGAEAPRAPVQTSARRRRADRSVRPERDERSSVAWHDCAPGDGSLPGPVREPGGGDEPGRRSVRAILALRVSTRRDSSALVDRALQSGGQ